MKYLYHRYGGTIRLLSFIITHIFGNSYINPIYLLEQDAIYFFRSNNEKLYG